MMRDERIRYLIIRVADGLCLTEDFVEENIVDSDLNGERIYNFFTKDGPSKLLFFYNNRKKNDKNEEKLSVPLYDDGESVISRAETYSVSAFTDHSDTTTIDSQKRYEEANQRNHIAVTSDPAEFSLRGGCVYFIKRDTHAAINAANITDLIFGVVPGSENILQEISRRMESIMLPGLKSNEHWGELSKSQSVDAKREIDAFLNNVDRFLSGITEVIQCLKDVIQLQLPDKSLMIEHVRHARRSSSNPSIVAVYEDTVNEWCRQVEVLLGEVTAVREENDESGPAAELEYWKSRMAKFNSITDQLRSKDCRLVLAVLKYASSPVLQRWKNLDIKITDAANEAKDNVRYLYILEKVIEPLYMCEPEHMINALPGLINAIKMMHSIARYYNTSERMTALFVKITNQMILCCRRHIREHGDTLWEQDKEVLIEKFKTCIDLNESYQHYYRKTKIELQKNPYGKQFDFSESAIFGKFDQFCWRIQKLIDLFTTINQFSCLASSTIDGIDPIIKQFSAVLTDFKRKNRDFLDYNNESFDSDYIEFNFKITELESQLVVFINSSFANARKTEHKLSLLDQFRQVLKQENLQKLLDEKLKEIFDKYGADVANINKLYDTHKENCKFIPRNSPTVSGNIGWARQLFRKIEEPMLLFQQTPSILRRKESRRIIRNYNQLAKALFEFEQLWYEEWLKIVQKARDGLMATILVRHPSTRKLHVNFDADLLLLIREVKWLERMGFTIPDTARQVYNQQHRLKSTSEKLCFMLKEFKRIMALPFAEYDAMIMPFKMRVTARIELGLRSITWMSLAIDTYIESCMSALNDLEQTALKANDIVTYRLNVNCQQISDAELLSFPDTALQLDEFINNQMEHSDRISKDIEIKNQEIESATNDLIDLVVSGLTTEERRQASVQEAISSFWENFRSNTINAVVSCLRNSVKILKDRISGADEISSMRPVLLAKVQFNRDMHLEIFPNLENIQQCVNKCARIMLESTKNIYKWRSISTRHFMIGYRHDTKQKEQQQQTSIFERIGQDRTTIKGFLQLTGAIANLGDKLQEFMLSYGHWEYLWKDGRNRNSALHSFKQSNPKIDEYERKLIEYSSLEIQFDQMDHSCTIGSLLLDLTPIINVFKNEAVQWKYAYGSALNLLIKDKLETFMNFMEDTTTQLKAKAEDLESVNNIMGVLESLRDKESDTDAILKPIENTYLILSNYGIKVTKEEQDLVESVHYVWDKLVKRSRKVMDRLQRIGPAFKKDLLNKVETFKADVASFYEQYEEVGPKVKNIEPGDAIKRLKTFSSAYEERKRKWETYTMGEKLFGLPITEYQELKTMGDELRRLQDLYNLYSKVISTVNHYQESIWSEIDVETMTSKLSEFQTLCRTMPMSSRQYHAYTELKATIDDFLDTLPLLEMLHNKCVKERHWKKIAEMCDTELDYKSPDFKVKSLIQAKLVNFKDDVENIVNDAIKEAEIETRLKSIRDDWTMKEFTLGAFKQRGNLVLKDTADLIAEIEESQQQLAVLMGNMKSTPFRKDIQLWINKLSKTQGVIDDWLKVQALWAYIEAVFTGGDIVKELPQVAKNFSNVDRSWVKIMSNAEAEPNVIKLCYGDEMLQELLPHLKESLERCQKSLSSYLEAKRMIFSRFFFLSDSQLLEIMGQGSDPTTIQSHLLSIFANIAQVGFDEKQKNNIISMTSAEGEFVPMSEPILAQGNIEDWLNKLVFGMQQTVKDIARQMSSSLLADLGDVTEREKLEKFVKKYPSQISLLGLQLLWTWDCEMAFRRYRAGERGILQATRKKFELILTHLVSMTISTSLTPLERTKIETLITIHIHQVEIFQDLSRKKIKSPNEFAWLKQTRFYWKAEQDTCVISITDVDFEYCYEYLGCKERLVITPLTDRIYISCAQAMGMFLGGAPSGPAGTGKTETTKDMGATMGKYFITVNCSDQMTYASMGMLFKGIAQSGCWCGFDEINRVYLDVLSVVAAQIKCIFDAMKSRVDKFTFVDGKEISLDSRCAIFVTMNPGYAGRTELPENMKVLFRTISVVVPDRRVIMKVKLASAGFQQNEILSKKFNVLYRLCEEQLSSQHYDFGLRNILSVLRTCGAQLRANPDNSERKVLMRVLRDMNMSKLVNDDERLFEDLIRDLFPDEDAPRDSNQTLTSILDKKIEERMLISYPSWRQKVIELYEQYKVRHGLCIMGPSGTGKSSAIKVLAETLTEMEGPIRVRRMNPKAITANQMFGTLDAMTNDWTDGIFSALWRQSTGAKTKQTSMYWIVLDGPVDAVWIENLNTVLDDTRTLTLANGDRLIMPRTLKLLFEVGNLDNASPATVSRMGMVCMGTSVLPYHPKLQAWLNRLRKDGQSQSEVQYLEELFTKHVDGLLSFVETNCQKKIYVHDTNIIPITFQIIDGLLMEVTASANQAAIGTVHLERLFIFAVIWSIGGLLEMDDRVKLHKELANRKLSLPKIPKESTDTVFDYVVDLTGEWQHWKIRVPEYTYPVTTTPKFNSILVPTVDNVRSEYLIDLIAKQRKSVLLVGENGTAKTSIIQEYIAQKDRSMFKNKFMAFSSATSPALVQNSVFMSMEKRMSNSYGPPPNNFMLIFIDDINMPSINEWGDQVTNELVRQLIEDEGFYSLESGRAGEFQKIVDVQFFAAMNHPSGGRNDIPERLKRHFAIFNITFPSNESIDDIFGRICSGYFCRERGFKHSVIEVAKKIPSMTRMLWSQTKSKLLPTPNKFHYIFNLRDLSRIFQGMLHATSEVIATDIDILNLWKHEAERVLADKLNDDNDRKWFLLALENVIKDMLGEDIMEAVKEPKYFVDFLRDAEEPDIAEDEEVQIVLDDPKVYEPIPSFEILKKRLEDKLQAYNERIKGGQMNLVMFEFDMVHLMRISRIIRTDRGNALLVGVGGSGKQSLTKLASFIANYNTFRLEITRSYNVNNLLDDLRVLYKQAVLEKPQTFIFTDADVKDEAFLEYINMLLTSGEIPGLIPKEERDMMAEQLRAIAMKEIPGFNPTPEALNRFFTDRARDNIHIVLCFSPVGPQLRRWALKIPGIISGTSINWFQAWPHEALHTTAEYFLKDMDILVCTPNQKNELANFLCNVHESVGGLTQRYFNTYRRSTYVTPKSYLEFISLYKKIYEEKYWEIKSLSSALEKGLYQLANATKGVDEMKKQLIKKERELREAQRVSDKLLESVTSQKQVAEEETKIVQVQSDELAAKAAEIEKEKMEAEKDLEAAEPALRAAEAALDSINDRDINIVKALAKPPPLVQRICDAVLVLRSLEVKKDRLEIGTDSNDKRGQEALAQGFALYRPSWEQSKSLLLNDSQLIAKLKNFDKDSITDETVELLEPYLRAPDFKPEFAEKASNAAVGLCRWVRSMVEYHTIAKVVAPKQAKVRESQDMLRRARRSLSKKQDELAEKQRQLDQMRKNLEDALSKKRDLEEDAMLTKRRMEAAEALIDGLSGERERWENESKMLDSTIQRLIGDVALASSFLSYAGPFNQEYRNILLNEFGVSDLQRRHIPFSDGEFDSIKFLISDNQIGAWSLQGLPNDYFSHQNGIIISKGARFPLLIDPQGQGKAWIKNMEGDRLRITNLNAKNFKTDVEQSIANGNPVLIEDVAEELDPILDNVLERNIIKKGRKEFVLFGDSGEIEINKGFSLYITTKLPNPTYTPEIYARTSVVDFTVTIQGLQDQLLSIVIVREMAELEQKRQQLMAEIQECRQTKAECEEQLLEKLSSAGSNILDDSSLIQVLNDTKAKAKEVEEKLRGAEETEKSITAAREEYRRVATRGSILYFVITEMSLVNCMYQTSLRQFIQLFVDAIDNSESDRNPSKRIENIIEYATFSIFKFIQRGLYERHRRIFSLLLALKIDLNANQVSPSTGITPREFDLLLKGGAALSVGNSRRRPDWLKSESTWMNLMALSELPLFRNILHLIDSNEEVWKSYYDAKEIEKETVPGGYNLNAFQHLLLIRCLRDDRMVSCCANYIIDRLGQRFVDSIPLNLKETWLETISQTPLIFLLSPGADPTSSIETLARAQKISIERISMGQGQEEAAQEMIRNAVTNGGWVLLQNCHLGLKYVRTQLEEMILTLAHEEHNSTFRLWITTEPTPQFSINVLQSAIKITDDPPTGVKASLLKSYSWVTQEMLEQVDTIDWRKLLYSTCFMHALLTERKKFGPLGFSVAYEFNHTDLEAAVTFLMKYLYELQAGKKIQYDTIQYMICDVQYGGRITDHFDKVLLDAYAEKFYRKEVLQRGHYFFDGYFNPDFNSLDPKNAAPIKVDQYRQYIQEKLPLFDPPEVFGLHSNAEIAFNISTGKLILDTIMDIQPKESGSGAGETREEVVLRMINARLPNIPPDYNPIQVRRQLKQLEQADNGAKGRSSPLVVFLNQEISRMQSVLTLVKKTLSELKLAIAGTIIMNEDLQDAFNNLFDGKIPPNWRRISWESPSLAFWFDDLTNRDKQYRSWLEMGRPKLFWFSGFFNPLAFLTAVKQEACRLHKWPLDDVQLKTEVTKNFKENHPTSQNSDQQQQEGVFIYGLSLEGAAWNRRESCLMESEPKVLHNPLPVIHITAVNAMQNMDTLKVYVCPVYTLPRRTDLYYVFNITLNCPNPRPTDDPAVGEPSYWTARGVAALCQT